MMALAPLFAVLGGSIMLEIAVPVLAALVKAPGQIDQQAAMAFFLIGAVHMALMLLAVKVASTMVAGWQVFGLVPSRERERGLDAGARAVPAAQGVGAAPRTAVLPPSSPGLTPRRVDSSPLQPVLAANDTGPEGGVSRETRVVLGSGGTSQVSPIGPATSRTRGIGNRFRTASAAKPVAAAKPPVPETYR
jgi:type IV secretion system protein VirB6